MYELEAIREIAIFFGAASSSGRLPREIGAIVDRAV
jgi:hypothetical protein